MTRKTIKPYLKKEEPKIGLGVSLQLGNALGIFKVPTYADVQRIEALLKKLEVNQQILQAAQTEFYKNNNLDKLEVVDNSHPLFYDFQDAITNTVTSLEKNDVAIFTLKQFNASVDGSAISFGERRFLQFWLVKDN